MTAWTPVFNRCFQVITAMRSLIRATRKFVRFAAVPKSFSNGCTTWSWSEVSYSGMTSRVSPEKVLRRRFASAKKP